MDNDDTNIEMAYWRAINAFAAETGAAIAKKIVWRLMRIKASGIFGTDYKFKTMWDEVCHNAQNGSFGEDLDLATNDLLLREIRAVLSEMPNTTLALLALADPNYSPEEHGPEGDQQYIYRLISEAVSEMAGARDLYRFERNWD